MCVFRRVYVVCLCLLCTHAIAILSAVFCVICCLLMFVSDASVTIWWKRTRVWVLLWLCMLRGSFPFSSPMLSYFSILIVLRALVVVISMCLLYVTLGSRVSPSILGLMFMESAMLSICSLSCVLYFAGSGVKRVHVVLSGLRMRLFV